MNWNLLQRGRESSHIHNELPVTLAIGIPCATIEGCHINLVNGIKRRSGYCHQRETRILRRTSHNSQSPLYYLVSPLLLEDDQGGGKMFRSRLKCALIGCFAMED